MTESSHPKSVEELSSVPLSVRPEEHHKILSTTRLSVILAVFVVALLAGMGGLTYALVTRIFEQLTPAIAHDLTWKAERGAAELGRTLEFSVALGEVPKVRESAATYLHDEDVSGLLVVDAEKKVLLAVPASDVTRLEKALSGSPGKLQETATSYIAFTKIEIEGGTVGEVLLEVSKRRVFAGEELRKDILQAMVWGCFIALLVALFFVSFYIRPLIRMTERAFTDLEQRTAEALESARLKSEFLANMSHEIRTPMNGVIGMAELLQKTELTKKQRRYARTITTSASALLTIINDILDFSKIEAGKLAVRPVETDVRHLVEEVAQLMAPQAQAKGLELLCAIAPEVPREVLVDHDRLRQVLTNITGNAVKFTNSGNVVLRVGLLEASADGVSALLTFSVQDTGIGIAKEDHERIFELFSQVDGSLTRTRGGTGLGLAISKHLVELMGGTIALDSQPQVGSTFSFTVRCDIISGVGSKPAPDRLPRTLIVDDNETNRTVLEEMLDAWGVITESVRSGDEALQAIERGEKTGTRFELALVDHEMSPMNGPELARKIRENQGEAAPRLVLLTSLSNAANLDTVFDDGLSKPFLQDDLKRVLLGSAGKGSGSGSGSDSEIFLGTLRFIERPRILVAEDNPINREVMREILDELEIECDMVENGKLAVERLDTHDYPLILMDCQMPEMDGYEATRRIRRRNDEKAKIPVVAVTAHAVVGEREKALAAGMTDYVTKPVTIIRLMRVMARYLKTVNAEPRVENSELAEGEESAPVASRPGALLATVTSVDESAPTNYEEGRHVLDPRTKRSKVVVNLFLKTVPEQLASVERAVASADASGVKQAAHKLKGGCLAIGARTMGAICAQLEPNPAEATALLESLHAEFAMVREALLLELEQLGVART